MNQKYEIIKKMNQINDGEYQMYLGRRKVDGLEVLIKKITYGSMNPKQKQQLVQQVNNLSQIKSNHVIRYYQHFIKKEDLQLCVILQYNNQLTLQSTINSFRSEGKLIPQNLIWEILMQIVLGLNDIHHSLKSKILHRNLKPSSILYSQNCVKIAHFGNLKKLNPDEHFSTTLLKQTFYLSPQQLAEGVFTIKTDIWAIGCLLFELATLKRPFQGSNQFQIAKKIRQAKIQQIPYSYSKQLNRIINICLRKNPNQRPTSYDLLYVPQISRRLKEKRNAQNINILKNWENQLMLKEKQLNALEQQIQILQRPLPKK